MRKNYTTLAIFCKILFNKYLQITKKQKIAKNKEIQFFKACFRKVFEDCFKAKIEQKKAIFISRKSPLKF